MIISAVVDDCLTDCGELVSGFILPQAEEMDEFSLVIAWRDTRKSEMISYRSQRMKFEGGNEALPSQPEIISATQLKLIIENLNWTSSITNEKGL